MPLMWTHTGLMHLMKYSAAECHRHFQQSYFTQQFSLGECLTVYQTPKKITNLLCCKPFFFSFTTSTLFKFHSNTQSLPWQQSFSFSHSGKLNVSTSYAVRGRGVHLQLFPSSHKINSLNSLMSNDKYVSVVYLDKLVSVAMATWFMCFTASEVCSVLFLTIDLNEEWGSDSWRSRYMLTLCCNRFFMDNSWRIFTIYGKYKIYSVFT